MNAHSRSPIGRRRRLASRSLQGALAACAVSLSGLFSSCGGNNEGPKVRHVVLITLDTMRADHLGCYGNKTVQTPVLDQLAGEGVRFASCTSAASTTLASHASIFTGMAPHQHGVPRNGFVLSDRATTLAERLEAEGFWCAGFLGSAALTGRTEIDQGFAHWDEDFDEAVHEGGNDQSQRDARTLSQRVLAHAEEVLGRDGAEDARLFLFAQYFDPHAPYAPPAEQVARYGAAFPVGDFARIEQAVVKQQTRALGASIGGQQGVITGGMTEALVRGASRVPTDVGRQLARLYAGEVTHMDGEIGRLMLGLDALGILDETLIVITADHGETFWERGNAWNHGLWVGQPEVSVPLIVRTPSSFAPEGRGRVVETPVSGLDVAPTVLDLLGLDGLAEASGRSLAASVSGASPLPTRDVFCEATQPGPTLETPTLETPTLETPTLETPTLETPTLETEALGWYGERKPVAIRRGRWKLVRAPYLELEMLFDLDRDPEERHDLLAGDGPPAPEVRDIAAELGAALDRWRAGATPLPTHFDAQQAKGLAALGYAEAAQGQRK